MFRGVAPFDLHRVGPFGYCTVHDPQDVGTGHPENVESLTCKWQPSKRRRCLTPVEMTKLVDKHGVRLLEQDERGAWTRPARPGE